MNYYVCSISFRHELVSFRDLIRYATDKGFSGIELWGVHAEALSSGYPEETVRSVEELHANGLTIPMISHYVDLLAPERQLPELLGRWQHLIALAKLFRTDKLRIFAGNEPSHTATPELRDLCAARLRLLADIAYQSQVHTVIEFHPDTYFDTLDSVCNLIQQVDHPGIRVNLDFLHVWESGCDPLHALSVLKPWIGYFHLKNVRSREQLSVFAPANVYAPSGSRDGLASLADGAIDYAPIIQLMQKENLAVPAALEWFGDQSAKRLESELQWLNQWSNPAKSHQIEFIS